MNMKGIRFQLEIAQAGCVQLSCFLSGGIDGDQLYDEIPEMQQILNDQVQRSINRALELLMSAEIAPKLVLNPEKGANDG